MPTESLQHFIDTLKDKLAKERVENARLQTALRVAQTETAEAVNQTRSHSEHMGVLRRERDGYAAQSKRRKVALEKVVSRWQSYRSETLPGRTRNQDLGYCAEDMKEIAHDAHHFIMRGDDMEHTPDQRIIAQFIDKCGCSATGTDDKERLTFNRCPLHAAAPELLERGVAVFRLCQQALESWGIEAAVAWGQSEAKGEQVVALNTGLEHIIMHSNDTCDCGHSYGDIARAAIAISPEQAREKERE